MKLNITTKILLGFVIGVAIGQFLNVSMSPEAAASISSKFQILSKVFLKLIKMIVEAVGILYIGSRDCQIRGF
jgi:Na+/H+-dicarboxylate symporter